MINEMIIKYIKYLILHVALFIACIAQLVMGPILMGLVLINWVALITEELTRSIAQLIIDNYLFGLMENVENCIERLKLPTKDKND